MSAEVERIEKRDIAERAPTHENDAERGARVRLYRTEAVVLRRRDLGEADRILTIFSQRHGKLRVVAKGVRKTKSRLAGHLEPYTRTALMLAQGRNLDIVTQAQLVDPYRSVHAQESLIAYAGYLGDLLDAMTVEAQENEAVYDLLVAALARLDCGLDPFLTARWFELRLLQLQGFRPELLHCVACGRPLEPVVNRFSPSEGGVRCAHCGQGDATSIPISVNALKLLRLLERDLGRADALRLSAELRREVAELLRAYLQHLLERELASLSVLRLLAD